MDDSEPSSPKRLVLCFDGTGLISIVDRQRVLTSSQATSLTAMNLIQTSLKSIECSTGNVPINITIISVNIHKFLGSLNVH